MDRVVDPAVVDLAPGTAELLAGAHDGVGTTTLRRLASQPDARFVVLVWDFPPGSTEGPHQHGDEPVGLEHYLVVEGAVTIVVDGVRHPLAAGDAIAIARESVRETRNESAHPARIVLVYESLPDDD